MAAEQGYYLKALLVIPLYACLWLPGFIANVVFRNEALEAKRLTGRSPDGLWLLNVLFTLGVVSLLALVFFLMTLVAGWLKSELGSASPTAAPTPATGVQRPATAPPAEQDLGGRGGAPDSAGSQFATTPAVARPAPAQNRPTIVRSVGELRVGVVYQLQRDRSLSLDSGGATLLRAGTWVRIDRWEVSSAGTVATVEAVDASGRLLGRGFMMFD
jgi:hypothetical protein